MAKMSVWSRLFGQRQSADTSEAASASAPDLTPPTPGKPSNVEIVPGRLSVNFYAHDRIQHTDGHFLSAVTQGLGRYKQRELVVTLRCDAAAAGGLMQQLLALFSSVNHRAKQGQLVDAGELTQFGQRALFGKSGSGLLYADAEAVEDLPLPARALAAVLVDAAEVSVAAGYGNYRVLTRLGEVTRHFPFPTWSDSNRPSVASERDGESLLSKLRCVRANGVSFTVEDRCMRIHLPPGLRTVLGSSIASLPSGTAFALLTKPAPSADRVLIWRPGQTEQTSLGPDGSSGSRTSGSCLVVVPGGQKDETRTFEDGYSLLFSEKSWASVSAALLANAPCNWAWPPAARSSSCGRSRPGFWRARP